MAKKFKHIKPKKVKTWLTKVMLRVVLPAYLAFVAVLLATLCVLVSIDLPETVYMAASLIFLGLLIIAGGVIIFIIIPRCRAAQALLDFENYDFAPYTPKESETFSYEFKTEKYYFTPSPFDDDEGVVGLTDGKSAADYFAQFTPDRLKIVESLHADGEFIPFNVIDYGNAYFNGYAEKKQEGEYVTVTLTQKPEITFDSDGIRLGERVFKHEDCLAAVSAGFIQSDACASVCVLLVLNDECAAVFSFGARIAAIIDKYKIAVENREIFDYVLSDPKEAFRQIGLKRRLKIKKKQL